MGEIKKGTKVSKNKKIVRLIVDPNEIRQIAYNKGSIYVSRWKRNSPASFIISMQFRQVLNWIDNKVFYKTENIK